MPLCGGKHGNVHPKSVLCSTCYILYNFTGKHTPVLILQHSQSLYISITIHVIIQRTWACTARGIPLMKKHILSTCAKFQYKMTHTKTFHNYRNNFWHKYSH
ncbi:hypothetical protein XENTR_v10004002 [Xenopus tropicalis]|nr:hypothetical protein XENTR_v10004002 [Xenopus tropicalis]